MGSQAVESLETTDCIVRHVWFLSEIATMINLRIPDPTNERQPIIGFTQVNAIFRIIALPRSKTLLDVIRPH